MRPGHHLGAAQAFALGGNTSTLAFVSSLRAKNENVAIQLIPLAYTPAGAFCGDVPQTVAVRLDRLLDWIDATFSPDDDRAFVAGPRELEVLARSDWHAQTPSPLSDATVLNIEDVPEEIVQALARAPVRLVQCASCRRLCVQGEFVWKDRELCAWDFHRQVFGKRGPWHNGEYTVQHFNRAPAAAYVVEPLVVEAGAEIVLGISGVGEAVIPPLMNIVISQGSERAHMAVRTNSGITVVRET